MKVSHGRDVGPLCELRSVRERLPSFLLGTLEEGPLKHLQVGGWPIAPVSLREGRKF